MQTSGSYIPNPNGTPTATAQFTNNRWTSATYDAAGDEITVPGSTSETFTYDGEYRAYTANANGTITYNYDGEGRRVQKTASTFQVNYVYDASGKEIMESTIPGTGFPTEAPYTGTEYLIPDHLGSSRLAINGQGQVVHRYDFLPFGEELKAGTGGRGADYEPSTYSYPTTPDDVTRKFTGKDRDWETGLDFVGARYMSNAQGRFTSADWSDPVQPVPFADLTNPQTLNLFSYVVNSPLSTLDDDGHSSVTFDGHAGTITVRGNDGVEATFDASNNPLLRLTIGKLVDGNYEFLDTTRPHHHSPAEDSHNGPYGPGGIFRLKSFIGVDGKVHDGVGLHAGRAERTDALKRSGCDYATNGCVRTTEAAISYIARVAPTDPLTDLVVTNNRPAPSTTSQNDDKPRHGKRKKNKHLLTREERFDASDVH